MSGKGLSELAFTPNGLLPPGDYSGTLSQLRDSLLVQGIDEKADYWDAAWRDRLVDNLEILACQLWQVGITRIFINGSFVEDKGHPNDIDGYFECDLFELSSGRLEEALNRLDEHKIWTWDPDTRRPFRGYPKLQLPMWHQYRVELYPHYGQGTNVRDSHGNEFDFPSLFRQQRNTGMPKGIISLIEETRSRP
jgi:hypothetical protein